MTKQTEALKLALEALESLIFNKPFDHRFGETIADIKEALAQPEQEPVAIVGSHLERVDWLRDEPPDGTLLYTTPPQGKPLTCFDTEKLAKQCGVEWTTRIDKLCKLAIEAAHGIKE